MQIQRGEKLSNPTDIDMIMKTVEVSDAAYNEIMSRRVGREAISETILRELKPTEKCSVREELEKLEREKGSPLPVVRKRLNR